MRPERCDIAIVGAGPVGLWLALSLSQRGYTVRVLEKRPAPSSWSRAIGVHPPALSCLAEVGVLTSLVEAGVRIAEADVYAERRWLARASFAGLPGDFPFILSVPQSTTESLLERALAACAPGALSRGKTVRSAHDRGACVRVEAVGEGGEPLALEAKLLVGCDGKRSVVRDALMSRFRGGRHGDGFVMGDFPTLPTLGKKAFVVLSKAGVVESFPLPNARRRWVLRTGDQRPEDMAAEAFVQHVQQRTGHALNARDAEVLSSFEAEHFLARRWCGPRMVLAGDAAHIVSPLGGQGMNLGLLDARRLLRAIGLHFQSNSSLARELAAYGEERRKATQWAALRARAYLAFARPGGLSARTLCVRTMLSEPLRDTAAATFAMARA